MEEHFYVGGYLEGLGGGGVVVWWEGEEGVGLGVEGYG